jgi:hypothetical protein
MQTPSGIDPTRIASNGAAFELPFSFALLPVHAFVISECAIVLATLPGLAHCSIVASERAETKMTATFSYARYSTRQRAEDALESMFAEGDVSPCEFSHIAKVGGMWNIFLKLTSY